MTHDPIAAGARHLLSAVAVAALCGLSSAMAAEPPYPAGQTGAAEYGNGMLTIGAGEGAGLRNLDLSIGRSIIIDLPRDAKEVFVANPGVANAVVRSTRKVFLIGMGNGATSVFVLDAEGRQIANLVVNVGRDLNVLRQTLRNAIPGNRIEVKPAGDSILLTGIVASASQAQQAVDIAQAFVGQTSAPAAAGAAGAGGAGGGAAAAPAAASASLVSGGVINALTIIGRDQVMLRVTVVELSRNILKELGVKLGNSDGSGGGSWSSLTGIATAAAFPVATQVLATANTITAGHFGGNVNLGAQLQAFERAGISRILAEPTLTAISGESANFIAGGEIPVPTSQQCTPGVGCQIGVSYKPYGVSLAFTPVVLSESRISLRINTEVTEIDPQNQVKFDTVSVPSFRVRRSATSVELPSGGTMMAAGLINQSSAQAVSGVPGLLNLPILGALFRSRDYQRQETELVIMVTPMIAKPMEAAQVSRPDDGFVETNDAQTILLGRLTKIYGTTGPVAPRAGRQPSRFGFITD